MLIPGPSRDRDLVLDDQKHVARDIADRDWVVILLRREKSAMAELISTSYRAKGSQQTASQA